MAKDVKTWRLEIDDFIEEKVVGKVLKVQRRIMLDLLMKVVEITPVGNRDRWQRNIARKAKGLKGLLPKNYVGGHARKNWQVKINRPAMNIVKGQDKSGSGTIKKGKREIDKIDKLCIAYLSNRLPYMDRLENGWSKSAPNGIAGPAVRQVRTKYRRIK